MNNKIKRKYVVFGLALAAAITINRHPCMATTSVKALFQPMVGVRTFRAPMALGSTNVAITGSPTLNQATKTAMAQTRSSNDFSTTSTAQSQSIANNDISNNISNVFAPGTYTGVSMGNVSNSVTNQLTSGNASATTTGSASNTASNATSNSNRQV